MKRILLFLCGVFICMSCIAETIDLNWYVDGDLYSQTNCEIGGGVSVPVAPEKYGYDFIGWSEVFFRGTFATWSDIPTNMGGYLADLNGSTVPQENDYIIVNDASDVPEYGKTIEMYLMQNGTGNGTVWSVCKTYIDHVEHGCNGNIFNGNIFVYNENTSNYYRYMVYHWRSDTMDIVCSGQKYMPGDEFFKGQSATNKVITKYARFINGYPYSGKWLLRYQESWDDYNRGGWVAEKPLD